MKDILVEDYVPYYDIFIHSMFAGDHDKIVFPFKNKLSVAQYLRERFPNKDGWELTKDKYDDDIFYYDWLANPSYEIYIRRCD